MKNQVKSYYLSHTCQDMLKSVHIKFQIIQPFSRERQGERSFSAFESNLLDNVQCTLVKYSVETQVETSMIFK